MTAAATIALVGHPNTGKTTLFNRLTGRRARVANYPGITVERLSAPVALPGEPAPVAELHDVPGSYSLVARSPEEQIAIDVVLGRHGNPRPDLVVQVVDATALERNLYLTLQLRELGCPMVVALNMIDAATSLGMSVDAGALAARLGVPVIPVSAARGEGLDALRAAMTAALAGPDPDPLWTWQPSAALDTDLDAVEARLDDAEGLAPSTRRALALWALMSVDTDDELRAIPGGLRLAVLARQRTARDTGRDLDLEPIAARYAWIDAQTAVVVQRPEVRVRASDRIDAVLVHPVWGIATFFGLMFLVFQSLFAWADPAIGLIETAMGAAADAARAGLGDGVLADFVADGLIGGVGSVVVFLPQIMLLFLFIGLMEDTGYMSRAALVMDRVMRRVGLHGRAFVPMLSGYACAVPAVMATRTMERRRDRFLTMMAVPLTTCSARLPVYTLIIAALFPATDVLGVFPLQGLMMLALYVLGTVTALVAAAVIGRTVLKGRAEPLLMELPPYRRPDPRSLWRLVWGRSRLFLKEAGTVILTCTIVLWALLYFPRQPVDPDASRALAEAAESMQLRESYAGTVGRALEPVIAPLGFDWKIGVGLLGAFAAREVFVSTMGVVYGVGGEVDESSGTLRAKIRAETHADGRPVYTPLVGLSLLVFFAFACQCMSTVAAVKRETGGYRWPIFLFVYMTALAWVSALLVYQGGRLLGFT